MNELLDEKEAEVQSEEQMHFERPKSMPPYFGEDDPNFINLDESKSERTKSDASLGGFRLGSIAQQDGLLEAYSPSRSPKIRLGTSRGDRSPGRVEERSEDVKSYPELVSDENRIEINIQDEKEAFQLHMQQMHEMMMPKREDIQKLQGDLADF